MKETDAQIFILDDPAGKHTRRFKLPEYRNDPNGVYGERQHEYLNSMREVVQPFFDHSQTVAIGRRILDYAKRLEEQGEPPETIVDISREFAEQVWSLLN